MATGKTGTETRQTSGAKVGADMAIEKYQTKSGTRYRAVAYVDGTKVQKRGFKTKREAQKWVDHARVDGTLQSNITFRELAGTWLEQYKDTVAPSTYGKTVTIINHAIDEWGNRQVRTITLSDAQKLANKWSYEYVHFNKMIYYTKSVFRFAVANDLIRKNPFDAIKTPAKHKETEHHDLWTIEQLNDFLEACKQDPREMVYPLFRLIAYTGIRRQEALALEWSDLDGNLLSIDKAITVDYDNHCTLGTTKNTSSTRIIGLDPGTLEALETWRQICTTRRIFDIGINRPYVWMQQICQRAGLPHCSPHKLRHLHCTIAIQHGAKLKDVQERLGHADIETTLNIYAHANKDKLSVADIFADSLACPHGIPTE